MFDEIAEKYELYHNDGSVRFNDSRVLVVLDLCNRIQKCIAPTCFPKAVKDNMKMKCFVENLYNTKFDECYKDIFIRKMTPDSSKYSCLNGTKLDSLSIYENKNNACAKEIMRDVCGEEAVENFDQNVADWKKVSGIGLPLFSMMLDPDNESIIDLMNQ
uniref:DUF19 domain-containing protein n=1 Tax=Caenorhabditis tropicalis TaxID=1561998 RepID=A0A1I7V2C0_9PELO